MVVVPRGGTFAFGRASLPWNEWLNRPWLGRASGRKRLADYLAGDTRPTFLMEEFSNPNSSRGTILVLATRSALDGSEYFTQLPIEANRGDIHGGLVLASPKRFQTFSVVTHSYTLGDLGSISSLYSWMTFHLWVIPLFLLGVSFFVARCWEWYLEQQAAYRLRPAATLREVSHEA
jgi:hypothetical protein